MCLPLNLNISSVLPLAYVGVSPCCSSCWLTVSVATSVLARKVALSGAVIMSA